MSDGPDGRFGLRCCLCIASCISLLLRGLVELVWVIGRVMPGSIAANGAF